MSVSGFNPREFDLTDLRRACSAVAVLIGLTHFCLTSSSSIFISLSFPEVPHVPFFCEHPQASESWDTIRLHAECLEILGLNAKVLSVFDRDGNLVQILKIDVLARCFERGLGMGGQFFAN